MKIRTKENKEVLIEAKLKKDLMPEIRRLRALGYKLNGRIQEDPDDKEWPYYACMKIHKWGF